ncbi:hypothetical protein GW846_04280 [Candidatus Gracilibacteria bacterium]|nr:hypothetical protein [Candidatus Gracilibacteria bacterium]
MINYKESEEPIRIDIQHTGVNRYIIDDGSLAVAHKIGGDNMGLITPNMQVARVLQKNNITQTYAVSAFRNSKVDFNTTDKLIEAGESKNKDSIMQILGEVENFHIQLLTEILIESPESETELLLKYAKKLFFEYKKSLSNEFSSEFCDKAHDYTTGVSKKCFSLLGIGEVIAAKVFVKYLRYKNINAQYVDTTQLQNLNRGNLGVSVEAFLGNKFSEICANDPLAIPIIPGFIGGIQGGILPLLGRGYTDYTASRSAVALYDNGVYNQVLLYIQKLYGFKSTDPRILGERDSEAVSVNNLSYELVSRAIGHKGAGAGLINAHSIDERIKSRAIKILVGNPTDDSDKALIDKDGNILSSGVQLVLGRDYNGGSDDGVYGRQSQNTDGNHNVYLMGENMSDLGKLFKMVTQILRNIGIEESGGQIKMGPKGEISLVFRDKETALAGQVALHNHFIQK